MGYLTHKEKSLLFSALTREEKVCKENGFEELVPVVKSLEGKFYYDRFEKNIRNEVIDEFAERLKNKALKDKSLSDDNYGYITYGEVVEIAKKLKGGAE